MLFTPNMWRVERQQIGSWLNRLRWKSLWRRYINDESYSYYFYMMDCVRVAKDVQKAVDRGVMDNETGERGFGFLTNLLTSDNYNEAYEGILKLIYRDW